MSDFVEQLETELIAAARRRQVVPAPDVAVSRAGRLLSDLRAIASGALITASVAAVAAVVAVVLLAGHGAVRRGTSRLGAGTSGGASADVTRSSGSSASATPCHPVARPALSSGSPEPAVQELLRGDATASEAQSTAAVQHLAPIAWVAVHAVYTGDVRVVRLGSGVQVVLVPTLTCTPGANGHAHIDQVLMGEIVTSSGTATVDLGTATHIRRGLAFDATPQSLAPVSVKVGGRWRSLAMVSAGVLRVRCSTGSGEKRRTTVVRHHLVLFDAPVAYSSCELTGRTGHGIGRLTVPLPPNDRT